VAELVPVPDPPVPVAEPLVPLVEPLVPDLLVPLVESVPVRSSFMR
jgi:hypothetical protein